MNRLGLSSIILLLAVLSGATAYFGSKSSVLERQLKLRSASEAAASPTASITPIASSTPASSPTTDQSTTPTPDTSSAGSFTIPSVSAADRVSQPAQTHAVADGETLAPIGANYQIGWLRIAEVNNLADPYPLKIGQILILPTTDKTLQVKFTADSAKARAAQTRVDAGSDSWRTDPRVVSGAEHHGVFGITSNDEFRLEATNDAQHTATVLVTHLTNGQVVKYLVTLSQPVTKGQNGIWSIDSIALQSS